MPQIAETETPVIHRTLILRPEVVLAALALLLRVAFMLAGGTYRFPEGHNHFAFGFETGSIAGAIARGEGFCSPFGEPNTGPTAWIGPVYPYLVAGVFKIFGLFSQTSAIVILTINSIFAALTTIPLYRIGEKLFGRKTALAGAAIWAVIPFFFRWAITWVWDPPISAFVLTLGVMLALETEDASWRRWTLYGVLAGFAALLNPALITLYPLLYAWTVWRLHREGIRAHWQAAVAMVLLAVCISPWLIRNRVVFGKWVFLRDNAGFEFSLGNFEGSPGAPFAGAHPASNPRIMAQYKAMGEIEFIRVKHEEAKRWAREHPQEFVMLSLKRVADFWDGGELMYEARNEPWRPWMVSLESFLALAGLAWALLKRTAGLAPIILVLLVYPLPYYVVYTNPRYRHAIEPLLALLIGYLAVALWDKTKRPVVSG